MFLMIGRIFIFFLIVNETKVEWSLVEILADYRYLYF